MNIYFHNHFKFDRSLSVAVPATMQDEVNNLANGIEQISLGQGNLIFIWTLLVAQIVCITFNPYSAEFLKIY